MIISKNITNKNQSLDKDLINFFVDIEENYDSFIKKMVEDFKLIFDDNILNYIFSNKIKIKYIFYDYKAKQVYYDFETYDVVIPQCYKLDFSNIIVLNIKSFSYFEKEKNQLTDYFKKNISKEKLMKNIIIPIKTGENTLSINEKETFIKIFIENFYANEFNLFLLSRNSDLINICTLILFNKYIDYDKTFSSLTLYNFEQSIILFNNIVKKISKLKEENIIYNLDIDKFKYYLDTDNLKLQYYLHKFKTNTTQAEIVEILIYLNKYYSDVSMTNITANLINYMANIDTKFKEKKDLNKINTKDFNYVDKYTIFLCLKKKYGLLKSIKYTIKLFNKNK